jgi:hypothetical protein
MDTREEATMAQQQPARAFVERAFDDFVAAMSLPMVVLGDRLGLYKAMAGAGPLTSAELAARTGTAEGCLSRPPELTSPTTTQRHASPFPTSMRRCWRTN